MTAELAGAALAILATSDASSSEVPIQSMAADRYRGAKVLNARGVRGGEIRRVENNEAVISIGA